MDEPQLSLENHDASSFRADQRLGYVEFLLWKQGIEVITGNTPRNIRVLLTDQLAVLIPNLPQSGINLSAPAALLNDGLEFLLTSLSNPHANTVIGKDLEFIHVINRLSTHNGMHTTRVVPDHSSQSAMGVRRRIGSESEMSLFRRVPQRIKNNAGLHPRVLLLVIQINYLIHVLGKVEDDGDIAALAGEACSSSTREDRSAKLAAEPHSFDTVCLVFWNHHANRNLPVIGAIGCVQSATAFVEADLSSDIPS